MLVKRAGQKGRQSNDKWLIYGYWFSYDEARDCYIADINDEEASSMIGLGWLEDVEKREASTELKQKAQKKPKGDK